MVKVKCHTNLDLSRAERWPTRLPCRPMVGDYIESLHRWVRPPINTRLRLRVTSVVFSPDDPETVLVELHLPVWNPTIRDFEEWYKGICRGIY